MRCLTGTDGAEPALRLTRSCESQPSLSAAEGAWLLHSSGRKVAEPKASLRHLKLRLGRGGLGPSLRADSPCVAGRPRRVSPRAFAMLLGGARCQQIVRASRWCYRVPVTVGLHVDHVMSIHLSNANSGDSCQATGRSGDDAEHHAARRPAPRRDIERGRGGKPPAPSGRVARRPSVLSH